MTPEQQSVVDLKRQGKSIQEAATILGITYKAAKSRWERAQQWLDADPVFHSAARDVGADGPPDALWVKTDGYSAYYKRPQAEAASILDGIEERFKDLPTVTLKPAPKQVNANLLALYAMADIHMGLRAWGEEVGEDYDTNIAADRVRDGMSSLVSSTPNAETALIVANGDTLHANDDTYQTPASKHILDVDSRTYQVLDVAIEAFDAAIQLAAQRHGKVIFCILPGNHDKDAYRCIMFALRERYRLADNVEVVAIPMEFYVHEFGLNMLAFHHGDKAKAQRLVLDAADRWPEMWGRTRHRRYFTGHLHHTRVEDIGGMQHEQLSAVTAKDAYASSHSYSARSGMQSIVYDIEKGEVQRHKVSW